MIYHVSMKEYLYSTLTERGQVSVPALLRKLFNLKPGQRFLWKRVGENEISIIVDTGKQALGPRATLGYARKFYHGIAPSSDKVLKEIREGEDL